MHSGSVSRVENNLMQNLTEGYSLLWSHLLLSAAQKVTCLCEPNFSTLWLIDLYAGSISPCRAFSRSLKTFDPKQNVSFTPELQLLPYRNENIHQCCNSLTDGAYSDKAENPMWWKLKDHRALLNWGCVFQFSTVLIAFYEASQHSRRSTNLYQFYYSCSESSRTLWRDT